MKKACSLLILAALLSLPLQAGDFFCKRYDIQLKGTVRLDETVGDIAVQDIVFEFPAYLGPDKLKIQGKNQAVVTVKNYGDESLKIRLAVALFDENGNLVGCGTTGSKLGSTRPRETETFFITFDWVDSRLSAAKVYYLTVETEPAR